MRKTARKTPGLRPLSSRLVHPVCDAVRQALCRPRRRLAAVGTLTLGLAMIGTVPVVSAEPFPPVFPLADLLPGAGGDGSAGFVLRGINARDYSGDFVSSAGDVNGDGIDDLVIAAYAADPGGRSRAGESYVVFGRETAHDGNFPAMFPLASLLPGAGGDGSDGFVLRGIEVDDWSGVSVSVAGDINGDGIDDLIIGASGADPGGRSRAGESYVVFGRDTAQTGDFPPAFELSNLLPANGGDGNFGFVLNGIDASDGSGWSVSAAGDINGDGIGDLIIGAYLADPGGRTNAGESYVVFGRDTARAGNFPAVLPLASLLPGAGGDGSVGFVLHGIDSHYQTGGSVSAAGDVNGDGIDDLIIGAAEAAPGGLTDAGESYVVFGRDTAQVGNFPVVFNLSDLMPANGGDGSAGFVLRALDRGQSGKSVSAAGDINGDGIGDLIIGAWLADVDGRPDAGESYVVFGRDTAQIGSFPAVFELSDLVPANGGDGSAGFVLRGIDAEDRSGTSVSAAGDVNGDGIGDLIIGATRADPGGRSNAGESYVVFGRDTAQVGDFPAVLPLGSLKPGAGGDGSTGIVLNGIAEEDRLGWSVSAVGDVNGDGIDDLILGAPEADPVGQFGAGESYVVFGRASDALEDADPLNSYARVDPQGQPGQ